MKKILFLIVFLNFYNLISFSQSLNGNCENAIQICTNFSYTYPLSTNVPDMGQVDCLYTTPNPAWFYIKIDNPGTFNFHVSAGYDIDVICWGPFSDPITPCSYDLMNTPGVDCSYSASSTEDIYINNALSGSYYLLLITNFANLSGNFSIEQTTGTGTTDCSYDALIQGRVFFDKNNNNLFDTGDDPIPNAMIESPKCGGFYFLTNSSGIYNGYVCYSPDTIKPHIPYLSQYILNCTPTEYVVNSSIQNANFAVMLDSSVNDIGAHISLLSGVNVWQNSQFGINVHNYGLSGKYFKLNLKIDSIFNFISSSISPSQINGTIITWDSLYVPILGNNSIYLTLKINDTTLANQTPYEIAANSLLYNNEIDADTSNNSYTLFGTVGTSLDPNSMEVTPSGEISSTSAANEQELIYTIHFQNVGSGPAHNIVIIDTLSNWLNIPSITLLGSSYPCTYSINGHSGFTFTFSGIDLPASSTNETGSHGFVTFKLNCIPSLANGGDVYNTAHIYFDSNAPVSTNTVDTYVRNMNYIKPVDKKNSENSLIISPNPANKYFAIKSLSNGFNKIEIYNANSVLVKTVKLTSQVKEYSTECNDLVPGSYIIKTFAKNGKTQKAKLIIQ